MVYQRYYIVVFVIITGTCFSIISSNGLLIFCSILLIDYYFKKTNILIGPNSIFKILYLFILREGKGGRKRVKETSTNVWEIHQSVASHTSPARPSLRTAHVPCMGIELETFWFTGHCSIHWATPARALQRYFLLW